jgi:hypothetical protein
VASLPRGFPIYVPQPGLLRFAIPATLEAQDTHPGCPFEAARSRHSPWPVARRAANVRWTFGSGSPWSVAGRTQGVSPVAIGITSYCPAL